MSRFTEWCDKCRARVRLSRLSPVEVCKQTHSSPAEYEQWCDTCRGPEMDAFDLAYERAAARYDGEGPDWR